MLISDDDPSPEMAETTSPSAGPPRAPRRRLGPKGRIALGLVLTFVGLFVLGGALPTAPGSLERIAALAGIGILAVWLGGVFLGRSSRG